MPNNVPSRGRALGNGSARLWEYLPHWAEKHQSLRFNRKAVREPRPTTVFPAPTLARCNLTKRMFEYPDARNVAILGDTHGLFRPELGEHLSGIDLILHSGDVGQITVLHQLKQFAPVIAVRGNVDDHIGGLPETELVSIHGRLVYLLHVLANLDLDPAVAGVAMVVSGHSHQPVIRKAKGVLYVNPGSVGPRRFKLPVCFVRAEFSEAGIETRLIHLFE
jgi:uncharacterized protein